MSVYPYVGFRICVCVCVLPALIRVYIRHTKTKRRRRKRLKTRFSSVPQASQRQSRRERHAVPRRTPALTELGEWEVWRESIAGGWMFHSALRSPLFFPPTTASFFFSPFLPSSPLSLPPSTIFLPPLPPPSPPLTRIMNYI